MKTSAPAAVLPLDRRAAIRLAAAGALAAAALVAAGRVVAGPQFERGGLALDGYDPVAYFDQGAAVRGEAAHAYDWNGATWRFASTDNRDRFAADPQAYAPQYDGHCAWAAAQGYKAPADPEAWAVVDGRLYVNYSRGVQRRWEGDISGNIAKADALWPTVNP